MNDRIKLAEAMGWEREVHHKGTLHESHVWRSPTDSVRGVPPDPFTDANDDYAVLEWMQASSEKRRNSFRNLLPVAYEYEIGDYARAALKVLT